MKGDLLIETTGPFALYYGAELNEAELAIFNQVAAAHDPVPASQNQFWFSWGEGRMMRTMVDDFAIGRERSPHTLQVIEGLGRD